VRTKTLAVAVAGTVLLSLAQTATAAPAGKGPRALRDYPKPAVSGKSLMDGVEAFAAAHPLRITGTPTQLTAAQELADEAASLGYAVETLSYKGVLQAVTATKKGTTKPDEVLVFGGHMDSMIGTVYGAYDNGTGTRTVMGLARAFAKVPTHRTLTFAWFNGEEEGTLASDEMAKDYRARGVKVKAYLGFDMVGIAYPVGGATTDKNCLCMWRGSHDEQFDQLLAEVNFGFLKLPQGRQKVSIEGTNVRNSDEATWADAGFPTLRWAGLRKAADYPEYHLPRDNVATMEAVAGGRKYLEQGLYNTLLSAYYTAAALDLQR
jgi:leucyl aminopeptidase